MDGEMTRHDVATTATFENRMRGNRHDILEDGYLTLNIGCEHVDLANS